MKFDFKYQYATDVPKGGNQYLIGGSLDADTIVDAKYIRSNIAPGNPYVEALPRFLTPEQLVVANNRAIPLPTDEQIAAMDKYDKEEAVEQLSDIRFPLSFHGDFEREFHNAIVTSYRRRKLIYDEGIDVHYVMGNQDQIMHHKMTARNMSDSIEGISMLGTAGCGKTSCVNMTLSHYPQVIMHHPSSDYHFPQIVYLVVVCPHESSFKNIYDAIAAQIDLALGNINPVYQAKMAKKKMIGDKVAYCAQLIDLFGIGMIIFDEIQQMSRHSTSSSSVTSLLTLENNTNVAMSVIGTDDAFYDLFSERHTARRFSTYINANGYCNDRELFDLFMANLFSYSWTDIPIDISQEALDASYEITGGRLGTMVKLAKYVQLDAINAGSGVQMINADFIRNTAKNRHVDVFKEARAKEKYKDAKTEKAIQANFPLLNSVEQNEKQDETKKRMSEASKDSRNIQLIEMKRNVVKKLSDKYTAAKVEKVFNDIVMLPENASITEDEAVTAVQQRLEHNDAKAAAKQEGKKRRPDSDAMQDEILATRDNIGSILGKADA